MEKGLKFLKTVSLNYFKQNIAKAETLERIQNPKEGGGIFFVCGEIRGAVSKSFDSSLGNISISAVENETGEQFYMLHNSKQTNVLEVL